MLLAAALVACSSGEPPGPDVPALIADLGSADAQVSGRANLDLIAAGEPAVVPLAALLADTNRDVTLRRKAASALWGLGRTAAAAVPALAAALTDADTQLKASAAMALENMGPAAEAAVPQLVKALDDPAGDVRQWAAKALGAIGPAARTAIPALKEAARRPAIRSAAEAAIRRIQGR